MTWTVKLTIKRHFFKFGEIKSGGQIWLYGGWGNKSNFNSMIFFIENRADVHPCVVLIKDSLFFFLNGDVFPWFYCSTSSIMRHSRPTFQLLLLLVIQNHIVVLSIISVEVTSTGCPEQGLSCVDLRPRLNSFTSYCAMNNKLSFYLFWFKPFQCKWFVTAQKSWFSIFQNKRSLLKNKNNNEIRR